MTDRLAIYRGTSLDPYENLAVEEILCASVPEGLMILYLWQNRNTVVIGRNQNAWKECRTDLLKEEGGLLARRLSGGGAVFHDLGNLNFTFIMNSEDYDLDRQLSVIEDACRSLGVEASRSGRNDVLAEGRKFSGNALYSHRGKSYHHGTLLVSVDTEKLGRYLRPSQAKLKAKGVDSVRSRVVNLSELRPGLTVKDLSSAMEESFQRVFGMKAELLPQGYADPEKVAVLRERNTSWEWNYGRQLPMDAVFEERFAWGEIRAELDIPDGTVRSAGIFTDSMDWTLAERLKAALAGARFTKEDLALRISASDLDHKDDLVRLFTGQDK